MQNIPVSGLLTSKKFLASLAAAGVSFFALREGMSEREIAMITGPLYVYIAAQGVSDHGKERARVERAPGDSN